MTATYREETLVKVAKLYYQLGLKQGEIARRLCVSKPTVIKMLQVARKSGIVEIKIKEDISAQTELEHKIYDLFSCYGLRNAIIGEDYGDKKMHSLSYKFQDYLVKASGSNDIIGMGWSTALQQVVDNFEAGTLKAKRIIQMGGVISSPSITIGHPYPSLYLSYSQYLPFSIIPSPILVESEAVLRSLANDPIIKEAFFWLQKCSIGIVGIGSISEQDSLFQSSYLSKDDFKFLQNSGAAGNFLCHFYNDSGQFIHCPWNNRLLAPDYREISSIDNLIALTCGKNKVRSLLGALKTGLIKTIIVDKELAQELVNIHKA